MSRKGVWLAIFTCMVFVLDGLAIMGCWQQSARAEKKVEHSHLVIEQLKGIESSVQSLGSYVRRYIQSGNTGVLRDYYRSEATAQSLLDFVGMLIVENPEEQHRLARLKDLVAQRCRSERELILAYQTKGRETATFMLQTLPSPELMDTIRAQAKDMEDAENSLLQIRSHNYRVYRWLLLAAVGVLSLVGGIALWTAIKLAGLSMQLEAQRVLAYERLELLNEGLNRQVDSLLKAHEEANKALRVRSEFIAKVSHELRTPLTGIIGASELVLGTVLTEEQKELMETVRQSGDMLLGLVNDILSFEKMELQEFHFDPQVFDLRLAVQSALEPLRTRAKEKSIDFFVKVADDVPYFVFADRLRIQQVLVNLVDNAIKFTDEGSVALETELHSKNDHQAFVRFSVTDTGVGIAQEDIDRIFDPFVQVDGFASRRHGGNGLGLSISKKLIELMHGNIEVTSQPDVGTKFSFVVPLSLKTHAFNALDKKGIARDGPTTSGIPILVVDDSETIRTITRIQLKKLGYDVVLVSSGEEAFTAACKRKFALILMDVQMPGIDGLATTQMIRSAEGNLCRDVPIIAFTAHAMAGDEKRFLNAGMNDHIAKPVTLDTLQTVLSKWVPIKEMAQAESVSTSVV
jgi:signal transduction histidine kinase/CheY-like chemotaxis protein